MTAGRHLRALPGGAARDEVDLRPLLGEIARLWPQIHPGDLTAPQALRLLGVLTEITERQIDHD
ncbi:hypothetical protein DAVIS_04533 [Mycobacterium marinum]|uniref:Uncharacterized protein n=1 Tax=Mycobacterium marinum TaxID=1781 RepID=A0A3E2MQE6_MYCMR|nr:hypothetical protein [Mycobacterium marinum]RFZ34983.1 hypothetical protein DAVIS_04533 [Mycobacterium marinum]GJO43083.1 hypothetical protein NJB1604_18110 [Mycobacterium marinum]